MSKTKILFRFGATPIDLLNKKEISLKAKGLYAFIQSKPDGWNFSVEKIATQTKDGKESIKSAINELEEIGYLLRKSKKDKCGKWVGYEYILEEKPSTGNRLTVKPLTGNLATLSKIDNSKIDIVKKKEIAEASSAEYVVIPNLLEDKQKHIRIIGLYARAKKIMFPNKEVQTSFIKRNIRAARDLVGYEQYKIIDTLKYLIEEADYKWTLETVGKHIDDDLVAIKNKKQTDDQLIDNFINNKT